MILHHGTSLTRAREAVLEGLLPRKFSGRNSFPHTPAHPLCVYMSDTYPLYFAENAAGFGKSRTVITVSPGQ
jgi:hypothetical protein